MKKKPIGYGKKDRDEMKALIERTEPKSGDYVGSGTVTTVPKKKKMKRMMDGGMAMPTRGTMPNERGPMTRPGFPVRGGGGVPLQGPGGVMVRPERPESKGIRGMLRSRMMDRRMGGPMGDGPMRNRMGRPAGMKGGGLARKGVGMALAKGGLVKANGCAQRGKTKGKMI